MPLIPLVIPRQLFLLGEINIIEGYGTVVGTDGAEAAVTVTVSSNSASVDRGYLMMINSVQSTVCAGKRMFFLCPS